MCDITQCDKDREKNRLDVVYRQSSQTRKQERDQMAEMYAPFDITR